MCGVWPVDSLYSETVWYGMAYGVWVWEGNEHKIFLMKVNRIVLLRCIERRRNLLRFTIAFGTQFINQFCCMVCASSPPPPQPCDVNKKGLLFAFSPSPIACVRFVRRQQSAILSENHCTANNVQIMFNYFQLMCLCAPGHIDRLRKSWGTGDTRRTFFFLLL